MTSPKSFYSSPSEYISSFAFDQRLAPYDIQASLAHVQMLARVKVITKTESAKIVKALKELAALVDSGKSLPPAEDIHYAIEQALMKKIGPLAGKWHTARSRNDQTVTALRLYARSHVDVLRGKLKSLAQSFLAQAEQHKDTIMPGFTHLQPAQPVLAAHYLLAYGWMFLRDADRLCDVRRRVNQLPLGAAALAGTSFPIDRVWVAKKLGFDGVMDNSMDAVSDRDFLVETLAAGSLIMTHLSRFAEELVIWSHPSFGFVFLEDPYVSGSSIMPQKRNPDVPELIRGKTGRLHGALVTLLTLLKAQPLTYNRDMQEDKPPFFDGMDVLQATLDIAIPMVRTMWLNGERMTEACQEGYLTATDVADALARRGVPFREAHGIVKKVVQYASSQNLPLHDVPLSVWKEETPLAGPWIGEALALSHSVSARKSLGGTAPSAVARQIQAFKKKLAK